jgi:hypothetical protein
MISLALFGWPKLQFGVAWPEAQRGHAELVLSMATVALLPFGHATLSN